MRTLDSAWQQFTDNTKASIKVTGVAAGDGAGAQIVMAGQLGLCEAAVAHVVLAGHDNHWPVVYEGLVDTLRASIRQPNTHLEQIKDTADILFGRLLRLQHDRQISNVQADALCSLGWLARSALLLAANMMDQANESGANTLDAVTRVVICTGHLRSDLMRLMQQIGVVRSYPR